MVRSLYTFMYVRAVCIVCVYGVKAEREEHLRVQRQADAYSPDELGEVLDKYDAKSPLKNPLTKPFPFNLMFKVGGGASLGVLHTYMHLAF